MADKTQKLFTSRVNNLDADNYIGEVGRLFYNEPPTPNTPPILRYSDGVTPGGVPVTAPNFNGNIAIPVIVDAGYLYDNGGGDRTWETSIDPQGFPRLPGYESDTTANAAIVAGDATPQRGQMYYDTTLDQAKVFTATGWQPIN
jgi:hypothetical protein